jgi:hypothetical protein
MSENPPNDCAQKSQDSGHLKIRYFYDDPTRGWQSISISRAEEIYRGKLRVPEMAGKIMRVGIAYVEFDTGKPIA